MTRVHKTTATATRWFGVAALLVSLASCLSVSDNTNNYSQYGAITVYGLGGSGAQVPATTTGVFFTALAANVPDSRVVQNTCTVAGIDTTNPPLQGDLRAGSALTMLTGAGSSKATTSLAFNSANVTYLGTSGLTYKSGDSATVSVPGEAGGFPASSVTVRLAEPLFPEDITLPPVNTNMVVRWNAGDATSAIILSIRYANPSTATSANEQLLCSLIDDGTEEITSSAIVPFLLSPAALRSVRLTRWRTNALQPSARSLLHIVSTVDSAAKLK